jgi:hypothetical protein
LLITSYSGLQPAFLVKVVIGNHKQPSVDQYIQTYFVPKAQLKAISPVLKRLIEAEEAKKTQHENPLVKLVRPDDDDWAWTALLSHAGHTEDNGLDTVDNVFDHIVECWALGEKLHVPEFQDLAMVDLLNHVDGCSHAEKEEVQAAFEITQKGSPVRQLAAEELLLHYRNLPDSYDLEDYNGIKGLTTEILEARERMIEVGEGCLINRNRKGKDCKEARWKAYMVSDRFKDVEQLQYIWREEV